VRYTDLQGKPLDITNLTTGTTFLAKVTVSNPGRKGTYANVALSQVFASGWEITRSSSPGQLDSQCAAPDFADVRDDRINYFLSLAPKAKKTFGVQLTAAYAGKYYLPGPAAEAMYDESINATLSGKWVSVNPVKPKPEVLP
jgi:alpha-2-macroglobulin